MEPGHETETPATADETPLPIPVRLEVPPPGPASPGPGVPTPAFILQRIAAVEGPWFPGAFAAESGVSRDSLDEPLADLLSAGLIQATSWVRGVGQGYTLTPAGKITAADDGALERLDRGAPVADVAALASATQGPAGAVEVGASAPGPHDDLALRPPLAVPILIMANAVWFFVCAVWGIRWGLTLSRSLIEGHPEVLHRFGAVRGTDLLAGEWWRLFTCCFVHIGALHMLMNMFALAMMGPLAELLWGRGRLLLIYALSGLAGSALAMAIRPDALLAGASGAIWGIQMSLFVWLFTFRSQLPTDVAADWFRRLTVVFLLNAAMSFLPGVSWEGHLGGGLGGLAAAFLLNMARFGDRPRRLLAWLLLTLLPLFCVAGLAGAMGAKGMPGWQKLNRQLAAERLRREQREHAERWAVAHGEYLNEVAPRLASLKPTKLNIANLNGQFVNLLPEEHEATALLRKPDRTPQQTAAVRTKLQKHKATVDKLVDLSAREPIGEAALDQLFAQVNRFATARAGAFDVLFRMLQAEGVPPPRMWTEWETARLETDRRWRELHSK